MDSVALQFLKQPLLLPTAIAIIGSIVLTWLFPRPTAARVGFAVAFLAVYSYSLMRAGILPVRPAPEAFGEQQRIVVQVLEIFWWFGAARLLVPSLDSATSDPTGLELDLRRLIAEKNNSRT